MDSRENRNGPSGIYPSGIKYQIPSKYIDPGLASGTCPVESSAAGRCRRSSSVSPSRLADVQDGVTTASSAGIQGIPWLANSLSPSGHRYPDPAQLAQGDYQDHWAAQNSLNLQIHYSTPLVSQFTKGDRNSAFSPHDMDSSLSGETSDPPFRQKHDLSGQNTTRSSLVPQLLPDGRTTYVTPVVADPATPAFTSASAGHTPTPKSCQRVSRGLNLDGASIELHHEQSPDVKKVHFEMPGEEFTAINTPLLPPPVRVEMALPDSPRSFASMLAPTDDNKAVEHVTPVPTLSKKAIAIKTRIANFDSVIKVAIFGGGILLAIPAPSPTRAIELTFIVFGGYNTIKTYLPYAGNVFDSIFSPSKKRFPDIVSGLTQCFYGVLQVSVVLAVALALSPYFWAVTLSSLFGLTLLYNDYFVILVYCCIAAVMMYGVCKVVRFIEKEHNRKMADKALENYRARAGMINQE